MMADKIERAGVAGRRDGEGRWRGLFVPLLSGLLFGAGLTVGGMVDPARVRGFLDIFGAWDPTLAFVMAGALAVMAVAWRVQRGLAAPLFARGWSLPDRTDIDGRLVGGAALFGVGWGISGVCPGPAIATLALAPAAILPFVLAMIGGMALHYVMIERKKD